MYFAKKSKIVENTIKRQVFKQADILYKATTPTLLSCIFVIHTSVPFKILLKEFAPQFGTESPKSRSGLIDYGRQNPSEQPPFSKLQKNTE